MVAHMFRWQRGLHRITAILAVCAVVACAPIPSNHGYVPTDEDLAQITVGKDTRETVAEAIGAPLNHGFERDSSWLYISTRREMRGLANNKVMSREIVSIRFSESGRVENIERFGLEDGRVVTLSARVTDPAVSDVGFLRSVFGRLGGITADQFLQ